MGYVILLWYSLSLPYNYFDSGTQLWPLIVASESIQNFVDRFSRKETHIKDFITLLEKHTYLFRIVISAIDARAIKPFHLKMCF